MVRVLCVHGVGNHHDSTDWREQWSAAISDGLTAFGAAEPEIDFAEYDAFFAAEPLGVRETLEAVWKMGASGIRHGLGDLFQRSRGFGSFRSSVRWSAGMVVQWAENDGLRAKLRAFLLAELERVQPELILAHSLGSLIAYDTFGRAQLRDRLHNRMFVSFGSQIGNPFVRSTFGGRIRPLEAAHWTHLYNPHDDAFAAPITLQAENFEQVDAEFDIAGLLDHDAVTYLRHPDARERMWSRAARLGQPAVRALRAGEARASARASARTAAAASRAAVRRPALELGRAPRRRALLIGINEYPDPADRLEGCVNDVFLFSELLQESHFSPDEIRVVLDDRADAAGIRERIAWLLDKPVPGDQLVLFYSGHGAQIPGYGKNEEVDHFDECLVPHDFDWSRERALTDDDFHELYSQLPYGVRFLSVLDCCHSGGMAREGGRKVRGLTPPDDIRHRALRWDVANKMWVERALEKQGRGLYGARKAAFCGQSGAVRRLGRAVQLRDDSFERSRAAFDHKGPYMPVIFEACAEKEEALEYRHGVTSFGAFTYALSTVLRSSKRPAGLSFEGAVAAASKKLHELGYPQNPQAIGPSVALRSRIEWFAREKRRATTVRKR